jgi:hypothetical protein
VSEISNPWKPPGCQELTGFPSQPWPLACLTQSGLLPPLTAACMPGCTA